jgi:CopG family nickel-responsive transcriptional regulator
VGKVERFSVSIERELLGRFDRFLKAAGYATRSEGIRGLIREKLVEDEWKKPRADAIGVITLVYDHHRRELPETLMEMQHEFFREIVSTTHIHLDRHNCLEVIIARGRAARVRNIANKLMSTKGVKHGRLSTTTTGKSLV